MLLFTYTPAGVFIFALTAYRSKNKKEDEDEEIIVVRTSFVTGPCGRL
jgi:hypothetical protein